MKEVTQLIGGLLGGQVRLFTTRCCQQELKALGADFSGTADSFGNRSCLPSVHSDVLGITRTSKPCRIASLQAALPCLTNRTWSCCTQSMLVSLAVSQRHLSCQGDIH